MTISGGESRVDDVEPESEFVDGLEVVPNVARDGGPELQHLEGDYVRDRVGRVEARPNEEPRLVRVVPLTVRRGWRLLE